MAWGGGLGGGHVCGHLASGSRLFTRGVPTLPLCGLDEQVVVEVAARAVKWSGGLQSHFNLGRWDILGSEATNAYLVATPSADRVLEGKAQVSPEAEELSCPPDLLFSAVVAERKNSSENVFGCLS